MLFLYFLYFLCFLYMKNKTILDFKISFLKQFHIHFSLFFIYNCIFSSVAQAINEILHISNFHFRSNFYIKFPIKYIKLRINKKIF